MPNPEPGGPIRPTRRGAGWRIGRLAGIEVRLHPTFFILVALALTGMLGPPAAGLAWLALLFSSVVAHELSHSLCAVHRGIPVREIVLLPIGGVSEIERLPDRPRDELSIAIVGPLTSLAIAAIAGAMTLIWGETLIPIDLTEGSFIHRLAWANVFLGAFNLLPALPLDGGRVLRAALTERLGLERATRVAASLGRAAAAAMAVAGALFDVWLLLIAAFVYLGSQAEEAATLVHVRLSGRRAADVMLALDGYGIHPALAPADVHEDDSLEAVIEILTAAGATAAAVHDSSGAVVGLIRMEDVAHLVNAPSYRSGRSSGRGQRRSPVVR